MIEALRRAVAYGENEQVPPGSLFRCGETAQDDICTWMIFDAGDGASSLICIEHVKAVRAVDRSPLGVDDAAVAGEVVIHEV